MRPQPLTTKHPHQMDISEQQQTTRTNIKSTLPPKPGDKRKRNCASIRRQKLQWFFAQVWIKGVEKCRRRTKNGPRPKNPSAGRGHEKSLSKRPSKRALRFLIQPSPRLGEQHH